MIISMYMDDCIIVGPSTSQMYSFGVKSMQTVKDKFVLTDKGDIHKFLGI